MTPKVSIIMPTYNAEKTIQIALDSIKNQSSKNFELLIIDGGSTDKTLEIISEFNCSKLKVFSKKDFGIYHAMNKGINYSCGDYIGFLGADDKLSSECIKYVEKLSKEEAPIIVGSVLVGGKVKKGYHPNKVTLGASHVVSNHSVGLFVRKEVFDEIGLFNLNYKISADADFIYRLVKKYKSGMSSDDMIFGEFFKDGISNTETFRTLLEDAIAQYENKVNPVWKIILLTWLRLIKNYSKIKR
jgi:glycosyltransferase involved in cell wall biosynthesis